MAPARRTALIEWAEASRTLVIEDDYDAEFRYDRTAVGAVQGLNPGRVAHVGTASKTLAPGVRLAWISLPDDLVGEVKLCKGLTDSGSPTIDQLALAEFLSSGGYDRHVVRARHAYRRRRDAMVGALSRKLPGLAVQGAAAGMHVVLRLAQEVDDVEIVDAAASRDVGVRALSSMQLTPSSERGILLGYGRLPETRIARAVDALASVLIETGAAEMAARSKPA